VLIQPGEPKSEDSDKEIPIINHWINNCQKNHAGCVSGLQGFMPTRVIDVGSANSQPRLVLSSDLDFNLDTTDRRYLALSHCWGRTMPPTATTTSCTLAERLREIPMAGLSRTFADFINISRRMRVKYVWIDSLCIIQDSKQDWEIEAAQMASVYSNSYCTISASSSANGTGGCHSDPDSEPYGPVTLPFNELDENGNHIAKSIRVYSLFGEPIANILQRDPISSRGWTFQERELSNRVLHYSRDSIRWECRSLKASLQFPWQDTNAFNDVLRTFDAGQLSPRGSGQHFNDRSQKEKERDMEAWFQAVQNYTGRALTVQSDKLPAFSGIARAVQLRTGDRYLAGLWESDLIYFLCWASAWHPAGSNTIWNPESPEPINHARQFEYHAPSWSWGCITGKVRYEWWIFHALDNPIPASNAQYLPQVLEATTIPAGIDEYGQLKGGWIRLKGKIKRAFTRGEGFSRQDREGIYDVHEGKMREVGMIRYDIPSEAPVGKLKVILCLCVLPRQERYNDLVGLALVPTGKVSEYRRVGLIFQIKLSWYEGCTESTITIV
jgi:Heterokaryon incompatibility protein (HET)